ncbi:MAG: SDR family oxidoreductase [Devosiaceae bacterium]|nr:SDR family oxidoreductase [Devosiaceae bacterium]
MTKTALITGAANRIGATLAKSLSTHGYSIIVHCHNSLADAENLCNKIRKNGGNAATVQANLARDEQRRTLFKTAIECFGPIDLLINNASIYEFDSALTLNEELWDAHFNIHAKAPMFLSRDFARQLPEGKSGNIINIIDERVLRNHPGYFSYTLSKSVLWTATKTLAQSFAPHIRVNAIGPGPTLPHARQSQEQFERARQRLPLGLAANPQDIAKAVVFLINTPSMTGQMITLDGGEHLEWRGENPNTPETK